MEGPRLSTKIQLRRDTAINWTNQDTILFEGEIGVETDTLFFKIGDGVTAWGNLVYQSPPGPPGPALVPNGTVTTPNQIVADVGIVTLGVGREYQFIEGSGSNVVVSAIPQITVGVTVGDELVLECVDVSNATGVSLSTGNGLILKSTYAMTSGSVLSLVWNGLVWIEESRNGI